LKVNFYKFFNFLKKMLKMQKKKKKSQNKKKLFFGFVFVVFCYVLVFFEKILKIRL